MLHGKQMDYDDDFTTCRETFATLRIFSGSLTCDQISQQLGIHPTKSFNIGDPIGSRTPTPRKTNGWFLTSEGTVRSKDTRRHIDWILEKLRGARENFRGLEADGIEADVMCYWVSASGHGGPILSPPQLEGLSALGLTVWWDVYFGGEVSD
jgi:hypothetical protein